MKIILLKFIQVDGVIGCGYVNLNGKTTKINFKNKTCSLHGVIIYIKHWKKSEIYPDYSEIMKRDEDFFEKNYNLKFKGDLYFDVNNISKIKNIIDEQKFLNITINGDINTRNFIFGPKYDFLSKGESSIILYLKKNENWCKLRPEQKSKDIEIYYNDQSYYRGSTIDFKKNGGGEYKSIDGWRYKGEFKNDKIDGEGTMYDKNNNVILKGIFGDDSLKRIF